MEDIELALGLGADRVVLGTVAVEKPQLVADAVIRWGGDRIVIGIDARDGMVATHGWQQTSALDAIEVEHRVHALGVKRVVFTDIARDGMLTGVNMSLTTKLGDVTGLKVIASGGVADIADVERLKAHEHFNIEGVIVGQAVYTDNLDLATAISLGNGPLHRMSAGVIPVRRHAERFEYLLLYNIFCQSWQFPRGGVTRAETTPVKALQNLQAETGLDETELCRGFRCELQYTREIRDYSVQRTIVYFMAETGMDNVQVDSDVHCEIRWASYEEAWELLTETGPEQLPALEQAREYLEQQQQSS